MRSEQRSADVAAPTALSPRIAAQLQASSTTSAPKLFVRIIKLARTDVRNISACGQAWRSHERLSGASKPVPQTVDRTPGIARLAGLSYRWWTSMIKLNVSLFPSDIANLLMLRGAAVPPLLWQNSANRAAKDLLDQAADDTSLFRRETLADEAMSTAVRAMLYLWNGWHGECEQYAEGTPDKERLYLGVFRQRQLGCSTEAKDLLQQLGEHPIFTPLAAYATEAIGLGTDPTLKRLKDVIEMGESWEPFIFSDLFAQSRVGKFCDATQDTIRGLQSMEFELLFVHCYEKATGEPLAHPEPVAQVVRRKRPVRSTRAPGLARKRQPPTDKQEEPEPLQVDGFPKLLATGESSGVGVRCPRCGYLSLVPEERRGAKHQCSKCKVNFLIPQRSPAPAGAEQPPPGTPAP